MMDWVQKYWQLLFVGTVSCIGGIAAPTLVRIIDEALTKIFRIISEKSFKEIISSLKKFNRWVKLKSKIIKYNLLSNHSFTEEEYNIYKNLKDKKTLTKNEKDILNYLESNDEIFINIIIREINNKSINHDNLNYDESVKCDKNESFHM